MKKRCLACHGYKEIRKLGNIMGECDACKGKGHIEIDEPKSVVTYRPEGEVFTETVRTTNTEDLVASITKEVTKHDTKMDKRKKKA